MTETTTSRASNFRCLPLGANSSVARSSQLVVFLCIFQLPAAVSAQNTQIFTRADTIRGSNTPQRAWWDATYYDLHVKVNPADSSISGYNAITYRVLKPAREMQIDLQMPLVVDSIVQDGL